MNGLEVIERSKNLIRKKRKTSREGVNDWDGELSEERFYIRKMRIVISNDSDNVWSENYHIKWVNKNYMPLIFVDSMINNNYSLNLNPKQEFSK